MLSKAQIDVLVPQNKNYLVRLDRGYTTESGIVLTRPQAAPFQTMTVLAVPSEQEDGYDIWTGDQVIVPGTMFDGYIVLYSDESMEIGLLRASLALASLPRETEAVKV